MVIFDIFYEYVKQQVGKWIFCFRQVKNFLMRMINVGLYDVGQLSFQTFPIYTERQSRDVAVLLFGWTSVL